MAADAIIDEARAVVAGLVPALRAAVAIARSAETDLARADSLLDSSEARLQEAHGIHKGTQKTYETLELRSRVLKEANDTFSDPTKRDANDTPCEKIFGACCAKATPDGGKNIKCGGDFTDA